MQLTHGLKQAALHHGDRAATIYGGQRRTYLQVVDRVARFAAALVGLGAKPGDRVAILALNSDRYYEAYYAVFWAGCIAVPCNTRWTVAEHQLAVKDCEPRILLVDKHFANIATQLPGLSGDRIVLLDTGPVPDWPHVSEDIIANCVPLQDQSPSGDALAAIFYTGGTTGAAKGVMLTHDGLINNFLASAAAEPHSQNCVFLHVPPMFHLADASMVMGLTMLGATHVILPRFDPAEVVRAIQTENVNSLLLVPTMIGMLDQHLGETTANFGGVERLTYGASPISQSLLTRALQMFPDARICQAYGQTELSPVATMLTSEFHTAHETNAALLQSAGRAIPGVDVRIADTNMNDVSPGQVGEVLVRGPGVMLGYWRQPDLTAQTIVSGWLRTGDAGYLDERGFLFLVDRVKDMIISGGENVYSAEVENVLARHASVLECAVVGVPDEKWGERVHAIVRLRPGHRANEHELATHCKRLIADYKCPRSFSIRSEPFPLSGAGKVLKSELRKPFWKDLERAVH